MASIVRKGEKWQARVIRKGYPAQNKTFDTKEEAKAWAAETENAMHNSTFLDNKADLAIAFGELVQRYIDSEPRLHISPNGPLVTKNHQGFKYRLLGLKDRLGKYSMENLTAKVISKYRDDRLRDVGAGTVLRELAAIETVCRKARKDWGMKIGKPCAGVILPKYVGRRDRILTDAELARLWIELKSRDELWEPRKAKNNINPHLLPLAKLALETAMRRAEMLEMTWDRVNLERRTVYLQHTKNGKPRTVPLSTTAIAILQDIMAARERMPLEGEAAFRVFPISYRVVDQAWSRAVKRAGIHDFRFHDLRHMAISRMAKKIPNVIELSRISGHSNLKMLEIYYHTTPEELAEKLG
ncbi:site-specific integrase [Burkholderia vietnamiensis]|uniref:site-specific integrase n=1 Tax=Burkholderia vietnamiensis TaxID=60552 RepID=UPI00158B9900|nr:site-specific integrase [Burkholderia vietnamiensis]